MPNEFSTFTGSALPGSNSSEFDSNGVVMCDEWEPRRDSEPAIVPSVLFTDAEASTVDWTALYAQW